MEYNNDFLLTWQGPWRRREAELPYPSPEAIDLDVKEAAKSGCDAVIFMVFNNFTAEQESV